MAIVNRFEERDRALMNKYLVAAQTAESYLESMSIGARLGMIQTMKMIYDQLPIADYGLTPANGVALDRAIKVLRLIGCAATVLRINELVNMIDMTPTRDTTMIAIQRAVVYSALEACQKIWLQVDPKQQNLDNEPPLVEDEEEEHLVNGFYA